MSSTLSLPLLFNRPIATGGSQPSRYTGVHETRFVDGAVVSKETKPILIDEWMKDNQESLDTLPDNVAKKSTLGTIWDTLTKGRGSYATYLSGWAGVTDQITAILKDPATGTLRKGMTLARLLNVIELSGKDAGGQLWPLYNSKPGYGPTPMSGYTPHSNVHGKVIPLPGIFSYAGFRASIVHSILASVYTDTEAIVETGCGFGRNIWDLINHGLHHSYLDMWHHSEPTP